MLRQWIREHYGKLYYFLGAAHTLVAIVQFREEWRALFNDGFFNQIDEQGASYQALGYWFITLGLVLIATGVLAQSHLNATGTLPRTFSWIVIVTSFVAASAMYLNGMWLVGLAGVVGLFVASPALAPSNIAPVAGPQRVFEV